jgi:hypothetical protein
MQAGAMITVNYSFIDVVLMGLQRAQWFGRSLEMPKISSSADVFWFVMFYFETRYYMVDQVSMHDYLIKSILNGTDTKQGGQFHPSSKVSYSK